MDRTICKWLEDIGLSHQKSFLLDRLSKFGAYILEDLKFISANEFENDILKEPNGFKIIEKRKLKHEHQKVLDKYKILIDTELASSSIVQNNSNYAILHNLQRKDSEPNKKKQKIIPHSESNEIKVTDLTANKNSSITIIESSDSSVEIINKPVKTENNYTEITEIDPSSSKSVICKIVKSYMGYSWAYIQGSNNLRTYYHCCTHFKCPARIRISFINGKYKCYFNNKDHTVNKVEGQLLNLQGQKTRGIQGKLRNECLSMFMKGIGFRGCYTRLHMNIQDRFTGKELEKELQYLPSAEKIRNLYQSFKISKVGRIESNNDLLNFLSNKICLDESDLHEKRRENPHQWIVIGTPLMKTVIADDIDSKGKPIKVKKSVYAFVVSSPKLIELICKICKNDAELAMLCDGTYRLLDLGWVVSVLAAYWIFYDTSLQKYARKLLSIAYLVTYSENEVAYEYLFKIVTQIPMIFSNYSKPMNLRWLNQDQFEGLRKGSTKVCKKIQTIHCSIHVIWAPVDTKCIKNKKDIEYQIQMLKLYPKNHAMFRLMAAILLK